MDSTDKEGADPNIISSTALRKRGTPASSSPGKIQRKRRMSMRKDRRRVSFAPDPELTMIHTFEKDDDNSTGLPSPAVFEKIDEQQPLQDSAPIPGSPIVEDMDITQPLSRQPATNDEPVWSGTVPANPGEITAALPSLGDLAEADEMEAAAAEQPLSGTGGLGSPMDMNITASLNDLGDILREDEDAAAVDVVPGPGSRAAFSSPSESLTLASHFRQKGQANKWGLVPGDDDTMDLDLKDHGRLFMGDRTYNRMYLDNMTGTTVGRAQSPTELTNGSLAVVEEATANEVNAAECISGEDVRQQTEVAADPEDGEPAVFAAGPNWTAPAFLPPYLAGSGPVIDHPALHQSPDMTNSSMNTLSTRRVSVDTRRQSITSRRFSIADVGGTGGNLLNDSPSPAMPGAAGGMVLTNGDEDDTGDLLADIDNNAPGSPGGRVGGLTLPVPHVFAGDLPLGTGRGESNATPGFGAASVGRADSTHNPNTATTGLLRTGGTTDMLKDGIGMHTSPSLGGNDPNTAGTHGTASLLRMDVTANSAIGARLMPRAVPSPIVEDGGGVATSPTLSGAPRMTHSPPASALTSGSIGRHMGHMSMRGSPSLVAGGGGGEGAPQSVRSANGTTPGTHRLARTPGSGMAIVPAGGAGPAWGPPGSAIAARYPGSAVATGRLSQGFTPSNLPAITFQDFAKVVEVQFLDNLRRGASINYADLQPNPVPSNLIEAYTLLCITSPNVAELETAIHTLQSETSRLRASAADLEVMLGQSNPPIFRHVQTASYDQLEALRANVASLKKVCRAKALALLKDVRCQMEESKAGRLTRAAEGLRLDLGFVQEHAAHAKGVTAAAERYAEELRIKLATRAEQRAATTEQRRRVVAARAALAEARTANAERRKRLESALARSEELLKEREALATELRDAQTTAAELRTLLSKMTSAPGSNGSDADASDPHAVLAQLKAVASLEQCLGIKVERTAHDSAGASCLLLQVGVMFRLRLSATAAGVRGTVELVDSAAENAGVGRACAPSNSHAQARRTLAAAVAGCSASGGEAFFVDTPSAPAALQATVARLQRSTDLAQELQGVRIACRHLTEVSASPGGRLCVLFSGIDSGVRFQVTLTPGSAYPLGTLPHESKIWFDGQGQITVADIAEAVNRAPKGPGRIRAVCSELSAVVERAAPMPLMGAAAGAGFQTNFGNPLFGSAAGAAAAGHAGAGDMPTSMEVSTQA